MTNIEKLKSMTVEEIEKLFCGMMETIGDKVNSQVKRHYEIDFCSMCPFYERCKYGRSGIKNHLESEAESNA